MSTNSRYAVSWDEIGSPSGDVQVLALVHFEHTSDIAFVNRVFLHGAGTGGNESAYYADFDLTVDRETTLWRYDSGTNTNIGRVDAGMTRNNWFWVRLDRTSSTIRLRVWEDGTPEPSGWDISGTDTALSGGWVGLGAVLTSGSSWFAQIGVGTGGDPAPDGPLSTDYTADKTDPAGLTDSHVTAQGWSRPDTDAAGITDTHTHLLFTNHIRTDVDDAGVADLGAQAFAHGRVSIDDAGLTDAANRLATFERTQVDSSGLTDTHQAAGPPRPFRIIDGPSATFAVSEGPTASVSVATGPTATMAVADGPTATFAPSSGPSVTGFRVRPGPSTPDA